MGHEITHHVDDRGRQFDAVGTLADGWQPAAAAKKAGAERVAQFYSSYKPLPAVRLNGHQVLGQKISDFGGTWMACDGPQIALQRKRAEGVAVPVVQGQTPEQRFFMINALMRHSKTRQQALVNQLRTGQHSPGRHHIYPVEVERPLLCMPGVADCAV